MDIHPKVLFVHDYFRIIIRIEHILNGQQLRLLLVVFDVEDMQQFIRRQIINLWRCLQIRILLLKSIYVLVFYWNIEILVRPIDILKRVGIIRWHLINNPMLFSTFVLDRRIVSHNIELLMDTTIVHIGKMKRLIIHHHKIWVTVKIFENIVFNVHQINRLALHWHN